MNNKDKVLKVYIKEFVSTTEDKSFNNFQDFLKYGGITDFVFKYIIADSKDERVKISKKIRKLDMWNKDVYTQHLGVKYHFLNEIE